MATQGPNYPGTVANLSNAGTSENTDAWTNPANVGADDGSESTIVAASYDSPDISQILVCSNFGFSIPAGATINGIVVEIERRSIIANSGKDFRVQLAKGTAFANLVGANKAVPATIWPTSIAVASYGGSADLWTATFSVSDVNATSFAVFLSAQANIANADIGVDFVRVTVHYTPGVTTHDGTLAASGAGSLGLTGTVVPAGGGPTTYATDAYGRTIASGSGLGDADVGGTYVTSSNSLLGVDGDEAFYSNTGSTQKWAVLPINQADVEISFRWRVTSLGGAGENMDVSALGRFVDSSNYYRFRSVIDSAGAITIRASKFAGGANVTIGSIVDPSITLAAGDYLRVKAQIEGVSPTTLRLKVWADGGTEPGSWQVVETDSEAALQAAGSAGWRILPSAATYTTTTNVDDLSITSIPGAGGGVTHSGALGVSGAGSIGFGGTVVTAGSLSVTGAGSLSEAPTIVQSATIGIAGAGTLGNAGGLRQAGSTTLSGSGAISFSPGLRTPGTVALTGSGALGQAPTARYAAASSYAGVGSFGQTPTTRFAGAHSVTGSGALTQAGGLSQSATFAPAGAGTLAGSPRATYGGALAPAGTGSISFAVAGGGTVQGALALTGSGALGQSGTLVLAASTTYAGSGALGASGTVLRPSTLSVAGAGSVSSAPGVRQSATASFAGSGSLVEAPTVRFAGSLSPAGSGSVTFEGLSGSGATLSLVGSGSLAGSGRLTLGGALAVSGSGSITGAATALRRATLDPVGTGLFAASGSARFVSTLGLAGDGSIAFDGDAVPPFFPLDPDVSGGVTLGGLSGNVRSVRTEVRLVSLSAKVR